MFLISMYYSAPGDMRRETPGWAEVIEVRVVYPRLGGKALGIRFIGKGPLDGVAGISPEIRISSI